MKRIFRYIIFSLALLPAVALSALNLPVKTVNGKQYFYYVVKKGDTVYSLTNRFGITRNEMVESNPSAADVLRAGDVLYFATDRFGDRFSQAEEEAQAESASSDIIIHQVKKGETLYGISRQYNVDQERIVALNPNVCDGVKAGSTLRIPTNGQVGVESEVEADLPVEEPTAVESYVAYLPTVGDEKETVAVYEEEDNEDVTAVGQNEVCAGPSSIVVMLPFMLEQETPSRQALLYTDFYKGLMIAADTLSNRGDAVKIFAYDTMGDLNKVKEIMLDTIVSSASVIIAPDDETQLQAIIAAVDASKTKVINVFNIRDTSYEKSSASLQANIPHKAMYGKALEAIDKFYDGYVPVILKNESGRSDKIEFVNLLVEKYSSIGVEPIELTYDGALLASQLESLPDDGSRYLFIPVSGALAEFNKFSHVLKSAKEASFDSSRIALFGYPDWTAFRGDAQSMLHALGAMVYSRFYYDETGFDARCLNEAFDRWYGQGAIAVVPNHGALGFDVGNLLIRNLRANNGYFNPDGDAYSGIQSSFRFDRADDSSDDCGYYNDDIYILRFNENGQVERLHL